MKIEQDSRFRDERKQFQLRFCCETCANFDPLEERCCYEFPVDEHRRAYYEDPRALLVFCKSYDLV